MLHDHAIAHDLAILDSLYQPVQGLSIAAPSSDYQYVWVRDNCYVALAYWEYGQRDVKYRLRAGEMLRRLIRLYRAYDYKVDWVLWEGRSSAADGWKRLHPRFGLDGRELPGPWGWVQNDAIGLLLWCAAKFHVEDTACLRLTGEDAHFLRKLAWYLQKIEYWSDPDNGTWEENMEVHASSVGCCVAGVGAGYYSFDLQLPTDAASAALRSLLPRESVTKAVDLAQLALVWPLNLSLGHDAQWMKGYRRELVAQVESTLVRDDGVLRYLGDQYHHCGSEARWTMGLPWLGLCHLQLGDPVTAMNYLDWTDGLYHEGQLTEAFCGEAARPCEHTPLAWSHALSLILRCKIARLI